MFMKRGPFLFGGSIDFLISMVASLAVISLHQYFPGKARDRERLANVAATIMILISSINLPSALPTTTSGHSKI